MINVNSITDENNKEHNKKWPFIPDHPYSVLIIGGSGSGKTNVSMILTKWYWTRWYWQIYLYAKDLSEPKYEFLIKKHENVGKNIVMIQMHLLSP